MLRCRQARDVLAHGGLLPQLLALAREAPASVDGRLTPWWEEAMVALSVMATLHAPSRWGRDGKVWVGEC